MTTEGPGACLMEYWLGIREELPAGRYQRQPVRKGTGRMATEEISLYPLATVETSFQCQEPDETRA